jgi:hypothetical protein
MSKARSLDGKNLAIIKPAREYKSSQQQPSILGLLLKFSWNALENKD